MHAGACIRGGDHADSWTYDKSHHQYEVYSSRICDLSETCTQASVFDSLRKYPAPTAYYADGVSSGQISDLRVFGATLHIVDEANFAVFNITQPSHLLAPGYVYRNVTVINGDVYVQTYGEGIGRITKGNHAV
jgi:hypothetical protein